MNDDFDRIDASLRRVFAPPDLSALHASLEAAARRVEAAPARRRTRWIAATAFATAAAAVLLLVRRDDPGSTSPTTPAAEHVAPDAGRVVGTRLAQLHATIPALPRPDDVDCFAEPPPEESCAAGPPRLSPSDVLEVIGECGAPGGPTCDRDAIPTARLMHVRHGDGADILVCIESRHDDPRPVLPSDAGLTIFRRELDGFVAYEITPLPEPHALPRLGP